MDNIKILKNAGKLGKWLPQIQSELDLWAKEADRMPEHLQAEFAEKITIFISSINWTEAERAELEELLGFAVEENAESAVSSVHLISLPKYFIANEVMKLNRRKGIPPSNSVHVMQSKTATAKGNATSKRPCCGHGKNIKVPASEASLLAATKPPITELVTPEHVTKAGAEPTRILDHDCIDCTVKHLVAAQTLLQRDEDVIMILGHLACAFNHSGIPAIDDLLNRYSSIKAEDVEAVIKDIKPGQPFRETERSMKTPGYLCIEYLAIAVVVAMEIMTGYNTEEYHTALMGNLTVAQDWATLKNIDVANRIRDFRLLLYPKGPRIINISPINITVLKALANVNFDAHTQGSSRRRRRTIVNT